MDNDKQLRASLIVSALEKTSNIKDVLPTAREWLAFINSEKGGNRALTSATLPTTRATPKKTKFVTKSVPKTKAEKPKLVYDNGRASIKNYRDGGKRYDETVIADIMPLFEGKVVNKKLLGSISKKTGRSVRGLRQAINKGHFPGIMYTSDRK